MLNASIYTSAAAKALLSLLISADFCIQHTRSTLIINGGQIQSSEKPSRGSREGKHELRKKRQRHKAYSRGRPSRTLYARLEKRGSLRMWKKRRHIL